jgi:Na+/H+-dicarboxylate symporter
MAWLKAVPLWARVLLGLVAGLALGLVLRHQMGAEAATSLTTDWIKPIGDAFVALIKLMIFPLITTTLIAGVIAIGDPKRIGSLGLSTLGLYFSTTVFAVALGLVMGTILQPGVGIDPSSVSSDVASNIEGRIATAGNTGFVAQYLTLNPSVDIGRFMAAPIMNGLILLLLAAFVLFVRRGNSATKSLFVALLLAGIALTSANILTIIVISLFIGLFLLVLGKAALGLDRLIEKTSDTTIAITEWVMETAPIGVFALMTWVMASQGLGVLDNLAKLAIALYLACVLHMLLVYGGLIKFVLRLPVIRFFRGISGAQAVAFSTASSSATLPVTIENVVENLGVRKSIAGSVLPLGATINMDGTSIYLGLVALFAAQALGISLEPMHYVVIAFTATLASVGAAGIPSAGLFLAYTVLSTFGVTPEQGVLIIAFIFPFDRLLDMMRTTTNVTGDAAVATVVAKWQGALDEKIFLDPDR